MTRAGEGNVRFDRPVRVASRDVERVWGGQRLRPADPPVGEVWLVSGDAEIIVGPGVGTTLDAAVQMHGAEFLGRAWPRADRFPLLVKLIDAAGWLSLQVHPDDARAIALEGPDARGKSEAWHVLEAAPGAEVMAGFDKPVDLSVLDHPDAHGTLVSATRRFGVRPGDTLYLPAGTIHALGPDLVLYEVQQPSDITYRIYDWGRAPSEARPLHVVQARAAIHPAIRVAPVPLPEPAAGQWVDLVTCPHFRLDMVTLDDEPALPSREGDGCHVLTVVGGVATICGDGWGERLGRHESLVMPARIGKYVLRGEPGSRVLRAAPPVPA